MGLIQSIEGLNRTEGLSKREFALFAGLSSSWEIGLLPLLDIGSDWIALLALRYV